MFPACKSLISAALQLTPLLLLLPIPIPVCSLLKTKPTAYKLSVASFSSFITAQVTAGVATAAVPNRLPIPCFTLLASRVSPRDEDPQLLSWRPRLLQMPLLYCLSELAFEPRPTLKGLFNPEMALLPLLLTGPEVPRTGDHAPPACMAKNPSFVTSSFEVTDSVPLPYTRAPGARLVVALVAFRPYHTSKESQQA
jgi:hypothetical protein